MISELPMWAAVLVALLLLGGALLVLLGSLGMLRAPTFYSRAHPPTLGFTLGMSGVLFASLIYFSITGKRVSVHELLLILFLPVVTPITMMLLARAALFRDRRLRRDDDEAHARAIKVAEELVQAEEEAARRPEAEGEPPP